MLRIEDGPSRPPYGIFRWWCVPLPGYYNGAPKQIIAGACRCRAPPSIAGSAVHAEALGGPLQLTLCTHRWMKESTSPTPARTMQTEVLARIWMDGGDETSFAGKHPRSLILHDHWAP